MKNCKTFCSPIGGRKCRRIKKLACACDARFFSSNPALASDCIAYANATSGKGSVEKFECENAERIFQITGIASCGFKPSNSFMYGEAEKERARMAEAEKSKRKLIYSALGIFGFGMVVLLVNLFWSD